MIEIIVIAVVSWLIGFVMGHERANKAAVKAVASLTRAMKGDAK